MIINDRARAVAELVAVVIIVVAFVMFYRAFTDASADLARMQGVIDAQKKIIDDSQRIVQDNNARLAQSLADIERARRLVRTPEQAVRELPALIPGVKPVPQTATAGPAVLTGPERSNPQSPSAPATYVIPADQIKPLYDFAQDCRECKLELVTAKSNNVEYLKQLDAANVQIKEAVRTAHGGSFAVRLKRDAKQGAGTVAGAAVGAALCAKSPPLTIAACSGVGALSGFVFTHIF